MDSQIRKKIIIVAVVTAAILMVPLIAMQFSEEVDWGAGDFIIMGALLFSTGATYVLISRFLDSVAYRVAVAVAVVAGLLLIWVNLAVGIIGDEGATPNLLYVGVLQVGVIGAAIARLKPRGMSYALYATAVAQALVPVVAMIVWRSVLDEPPGMVGVFILNGFFVAMFIVSAALFRQASTSVPEGSR